MHLPMPVRMTSQKQQRRGREPSTSPCTSVTELSDEGDDLHSRYHKRKQSLPRLNSLLQREREDTNLSTGSPPSHSDLSQLLEQKMVSLLDPSSLSTQSSETQLIQVAVRCRRRRIRDANVGCNDSTSDHSASDAEDSERAPDGILEYEIEDFDRPLVGSKALPAVSLPSQVLTFAGTGPRRRFEFDHVFPPWKLQSDVYNSTARGAIERVLNVAVEGAVNSEARRGDPNGVNGSSTSPSLAHATFVAYGQTGTGKTYTMGLQLQPTIKDDAEYGIIPRAMIDILSRINDFNCSPESGRGEVQLTASMSFLQIYLEGIQDLLAPPDQPFQPTRQHGDRRQLLRASSNLQVRLDPSTNVFYVVGLSEIPIEQVGDARALLEFATQNRVLAATARNKTSSRSHTLLTIYIRQKYLKSECGVGFDDRPCSVSFVDLAGSERVEGALHFLHATRKRQELRIREAKFINRSLSALGSVIAALATQEERRSRIRWPEMTKRTRSPTRKSANKHIRFRDSQLTKLLQSRLMTGNGSLVLIATIDDQPANLAETLSTLKFATQCRRVDLSQNRSKAEAARKRREETLLSQVFAEVKVMYEQREAALREQYEKRLKALDESLRTLEGQHSETTLPAQPKSATAAYVALCSLADITRPTNRVHFSDHPSIDSFKEEASAVDYVAGLYREVKAALVSGSSISTTNSHSERSVWTSLRRRQGSKIGMHEQSTLELVDFCQESSDATASDDNLNGHDAEFGAILQHLIASGALEDVVVSSEEEDAE